MARIPTSEARVHWLKGISSWSQRNTNVLCKTANELWLKTSHWFKIPTISRYLQKSKVSNKLINAIFHSHVGVFEKDTSCVTITIKQKKRKAFYCQASWRHQNTKFNVIKNQNINPKMWYNFDFSCAIFAINFGVISYINFGSTWLFASGSLIIQRLSLLLK